MGEEGHRCHGTLVEMVTFPWRQEDNEVGGGGHVSRRQAPEEPAANLGGAGEDAT